MSDREPPIDLRLVLPAAGAWAGAGVGVLGGDAAWLAAGIGVLVSALAALRRSWTALGFGIALAGAALVAAWWAAALTSSTPARWADDGAFVEARAVVLSEARHWEARGSRPELAVLQVRLVSGTARAAAWQGALPAQLSATGDATGLLDQRVGATIEFGAIARAADPGDRSVGTFSLRGAVSEVAEPGPGAALANRFRAGLRNAMAASPPEQAGLVPSLVVGDTSGLPASVDASFRATGLTHLTAVSGTNLTLMLVFTQALAKQLGVRGWWLRLLGVGVAVAFVVVCRAEPSVLRAAAMGLVALAATGLARDRRRGLRTLATAVAVLVLTEPWLARSWGFALSVTASAGILWWGSDWQLRMRRWAPGWLAEALAIPLSAQLATQPIVTALSGNVSVVGLAANMLTGPFVGPVTILGLTAALASLVSPPLAEVLGWAAGWCVQPVLLVAHVGAAAPAATWQWPATATALALLAALTLACAQLVPWVLDHRWAVVLLGVLLVVGALRQPPQPGWPGDWLVVACDVGQGGAQLVRAGRDSAVLVDTGPDPQALSACLQSVGVREISLLVITHGHADHVGGISAVAGKLPVKLVLTGEAPGGPAAARPAWPAGLPEAQVTRPGDVVDLGTLSWTTLAAGPVPGMTAADAGESSAENDSGVVGVIDVGGTRILVTGDIELAGQQALVASGRDLRADVLVVPHHGSPRQDPGFIEAVAPRVALVQVGEDNDYGHPAGRTLDLLAEGGAVVFRTDQQGAVAVQRSGGRVVTQR